MGACGVCQNRAVPAQAPAPLFHIRRGYRARWNDLAVSVESDAHGWTLRVHSVAGELLYMAYRGAAMTAKVAAAEFAIFHVLGCGSRLNPNRLAEQLNWQEYW